MLIIPTLRRLKQEYKLKASLGYTEKTLLQSPKICDMYTYNRILKLPKRIESYPLC
jgi:hypothetical protein